MHADVLTIGAGLSGGAAALRLAQQGVSVVCLERGELPDRLQYCGGEAAWELTATKPWSRDPNVRAGSADYRLDQAECETRIANHNGSGEGPISSTLFKAVWPRLTPDDFKSRTAASYGEGHAALVPVDRHEIGAVGSRERGSPMPRVITCAAVRPDDIRSQVRASSSRSGPPSPCVKSTTRIPTNGKPAPSGQSCRSLRHRRNTHSPLTVWSAAAR
jgi:choline dehydrogenase-like flavoprotein